MLDQAPYHQVPATTADGFGTDAVARQFGGLSPTLLSAIDAILLEKAAVLRDAEENSSPPPMDEFLRQFTTCLLKPCTAPGVPTSVPLLVAKQLQSVGWNVANNEQSGAALPSLEQVAGMVAATRQELAGIGHPQPASKGTAQSAVSGQGNSEYASAGRWKARAMKVSMVASSIVCMCGFSGAIMLPNFVSDGWTAACWSVAVMFVGLLMLSMCGWLDARRRGETLWKTRPGGSSYHNNMNANNRDWRAGGINDWSEPLVFDFR